MRTLVYKMTHTGDPGEDSGVWGARDCMGQSRAYEYDAVIGVGGLSATDRIAGKLVWIGIGPRKRATLLYGARAPEVTFREFRYYGHEGPLLAKIAPSLARRMYGGRARILLNASPDEGRDVERLLAMSKRPKPSRGMPRAMARRCATPAKRRCG